MKKILTLFFVILTLYFNAGVGYALQIPAGTIIPVVFVDNVSSDTLKTGDVVSVRVANDVYVSNKKVFTKDTQGVAYVSKAFHSAHHGKAGIIEISNAKIQDVGGKKHDVQLNAAAKGKHKRPSSIALSVIGVCLILVPFGCWRYGEPAVLPASQVFSAVLPADSDL